MIDGMDNTWSADHLRVSLFSKDVWSTPAEDIFSNVFEGSPETITNKPTVNEFSAVGSWEGLRLEVKRTFNRIDFVVQAMPSETEPMPLIKDVQLVLPRVSSRIARWVSTQSQGVVRIALGCNALLLSQSNEDSYVKLKNLIKVIDVDVGRFKEFRFQVNLPSPSSVSPDITINRLSNWASIALRSALLGIDAPQFFDDKNYVSCSLDVNTDGERNLPITVDLIEKLTEELSLICIDTLDKGIS